MGRDDDTRDDPAAADPDRTRQMVACTREITEALTALGTWLAAADLQLRRSLGPSDGLSQSIEHAIRQQRRAGEAVRALHELLRRTAGDSDEVA